MKNTDLVLYRVFAISFFLSIRNHFIFAWSKLLFIQKLFTIW